MSEYIRGSEEKYCFMKFYCVCAHACMHVCVYVYCVLMYTIFLSMGCGKKILESHCHRYTVQIGSQYLVLIP